MEQEGLEELDDLIQVCYSQQKPSVVHLQYQKKDPGGELTLSIVVESELYQWKSTGKSSFDSLYVRETDQTLYSMMIITGPSFSCRIRYIGTPTQSLFSAIG